MNKVVFDDLREKAIEQKIPIAVHLDLTYKCNLNCIHCYIVDQNRPELSTKEIKNILEQLAEAKTLYLTLSGGEILTREDFFEIVSYARKLNFSLRLLTNGTLIDWEIADRIASLYPELVAISLYSVDSEIHDKITNRSGSFNKTIQSVKMLRDKGVHLKISTIIMRQNIENYPSVHKIAEDFKAEFQADYRIISRMDGDKSPSKFAINDRDLPFLLADPIFLENYESEPQDINLKSFEIFPCGAGHMSCYISPYGDVFPCIQLQIKCGNLKKKTFDNIWRKSDKMQDIRSVTIFNLSQCSQCESFQYCRLCIGLNHSEESNILFPSVKTCKEAKILRELGKKRR